MAQKKKAKAPNKKAKAKATPKEPLTKLPRKKSNMYMTLEKRPMEMQSKENCLGAKELTLRRWQELDFQSLRALLLPPRFVPIFTNIKELTPRL
jgi:hypothetical protein